MDKHNKDGNDGGQNGNATCENTPMILAAITLRLVAEARRLQMPSAVYYLEMAAQDLLARLTSEDQEAVEHLIANIRIH
jgi:hypothetical protein